VDPISKEYPELTPFQFASNTPIMAIDLDGLEAYLPIGSILIGDPGRYDDKSMKAMQKSSSMALSIVAALFTLPFSGPVEIVAGAGGAVLETTTAVVINGGSKLPWLLATAEIATATLQNPAYQQAAVDAGSFLLSLVSDDPNLQIPNSGGDELGLITRHTLSKGATAVLENIMKYLPKGKEGQVINYAVGVFTDAAGKTFKGAATSSAMELSGLLKKTALKAGNIFKETIINRGQDSELKFFNNLAAYLGATAGDAEAGKVFNAVKDEVTILSYLTPCASCGAVIEKQFHKMFPNVKINIVSTVHKSMDEAQAVLKK
jgi:hypothetical protein